MKEYSEMGKYRYYHIVKREAPYHFFLNLPETERARQRQRQRHRQTETDRERDRAPWVISSQRLKSKVAF